jgi:hypothetical protein
MGFCFIASKSGKVIDIQRASKQEVADLDAFQQKSTDNDNQQWEFKPGPAGTPSDVFMISSKLDGSVISISPSGTLVANKKLADQFLWRFVEDPAGSGYCFIQSAFAPNSVIAINGDKNGAPLGLGPIATADNKLWKPRGEKFPSTVSLPSTLNFTGGTGNGTTGSDAAECAYEANLTIQQNGTCHFWGSYTNRGDTFDSTAPPQDFGVTFVVHDLDNAPYVFAYGGFVWSAPQAGSVDSWNVTQHSTKCTSNWASIASRNQASVSVSTQAVNPVTPVPGGQPFPPGDTWNTIYSVLGKASVAADGPANVVVSPDGFTFTVGPGPNTVIVDFGNFELYTGVVSGSGHGGVSGASFPPGWVPSGSGAEL